jgi:hypothetical protein
MSKPNFFFFFTKWVPQMRDVLFFYSHYTVLKYFNSKSKLYYDQQSVGQSVLVSGTHLGPATNFPLLSLIIFRRLWVCWCGGALSDEKTSLLFLVFTRHRQRCLSQIWVPQDSWAYFIVSIFETPPTWRARFLYLFPPGTWYPSYTPLHWVKVFQKAFVL